MSVKSALEVVEIIPSIVDETVTVTNSVSTSSIVIPEIFIGNPAKLVPASNDTLVMSTVGFLSTSNVN